MVVVVVVVVALEDLDFRPLRPPGDCCCPGAPLPNGTPPGAHTSLCRHAVEGVSSSALPGRSKVPLTHRAARSGSCWSGARGECA